MQGDRERWNAKWRERAGELERPSAFLVDHAALLPEQGRALDLAGGAGRNAIWLARRGLDVTLADVSDLALERAERRAIEAGLAGRVRFVRVDLDDELPFAPIFDLLVVANYLNRARRDDHVAVLRTGGLLVATQPTATNLERHAHPSRAYLVEPGELAAWVRGRGMELLVDEEGWTAEGRHVACVIARRTAAAEEEPAAPDEPAPAQGPYR